VSGHSFHVDTTTFAAALEKEMARVARKELREEIVSLRESSSTYRSGIAELKRKTKAMGSLNGEAARSRHAQRSSSASAPMTIGHHAEAGRCASSRGAPEDGFWDTWTMRHPRKSLNLVRLAGIEPTMASEPRSDAAQDQAVK